MRNSLKYFTALGNAIVGKKLLDLEGHIEDVKDLNSKYDIKIEALETRIGFEERMKITCRDDYDKLKEDNHKLSADNSKLEHELKTVKLNFDELVDDIGKLKKYIEQKEKAQDDLRAHIMLLSADKTKLVKENSSLRDGVINYTDIEIDSYVKELNSMLNNKKMKPIRFKINAIVEHFKSKLSDRSISCRVVKLIRKKHENGTNIDDLVNQFDVTKSMLVRIINKTSYKDCI